MKSTISRFHLPIAATLLLLFTARYAGAQGAVTPFTSYEAEAGTVGGGAKVVSLTSAPTTQYSSPELEASGHAYVQLTGPGQFVRWTNKTGKPAPLLLRDIRMSVGNSNHRRCDQPTQSAKKFGQVPPIERENPGQSVRISA